MAPVPAVRDRAIVAVLTADNTPVGVGCLVAPTLVLTCAHVVNTALGLPIDGQEQPEEALWVAQAIPRSAPVMASVEHWRPITPDTGDVAILRLAEPVSDSVAAPFIDVVSTVGHSFLAFGYPSGQPDGIWASGQLLPQQGKGWSILQSVLQSGSAVEEGFSGSPVWDDNLAGFIGMVVSKDLAPQHRLAFMIPVALLRREWAGLSKAIAPSANALPVRGALRQLPTIRLPKNITGHEAHIYQISDALANDHEDPVYQAIAGPPGTGKSTLAVAAAMAASQAYPDGQFYIDMRGTERRPLEAEAVLPDLLERLGVAPSELPAWTEDRERLYQEVVANRAILLLLDNVVTERQVRTLLPVLGRSACLLTSRAVLGGLQDVDVLRLDILPEEASVKLLRQSIPPIQLGPTPAELLSEIAALCGYLPLSLEIIALKLRSKPHWTLRAIRDDLASAEKRLDVLTVGDREVRAVFGLSYSDLPSFDRKTFRRLGLLRGADFPGWMAGPLTSSSCQNGTSSVERLVDAGLVQPIVVDTRGETWYRLHDLLRMFAREQVEAEDSEDDIRRSVENLLFSLCHIAQAAEEQLNPGGLYPRQTRNSRDRSAGVLLPHDLSQVYVGIDPSAWFAAAKVNLINAVALGWDHELWTLCWQLANALTTYLAWNDRWDDYRQSLETAVLASRQDNDPMAEAYSLRNLGIIHLYEHRWEDAATCLEQARLLFEEHRNSRWLAVVQRDLGDLRRLQHRDAEARSLLEASRATAVAAADQLGVAWTERSLADLALRSGDLGNAESLIESAIAVLADSRDTRATAEAMSIRASVLAEHGDWPTARDSFSIAIDLAEGTHDRNLEGDILIRAISYARNLSDQLKARHWGRRLSEIQPEAST
jgi:tetratricopeptide (TPR) repeat protein